MLVSSCYVLAWMPRWLRRWASSLLTYWMIRRPNKRKHRISVNMRIFFPEFSQEKKNEYVRLNIGFLMYLLFEMPRILIREGSRAIARISEVKGKDLALKAVQQNKGVILMLPHLGNWEILAPYLGKEFSCTALYKPFYNQHLNEIVRKYRTATGMKLVPTDRTGVKQLLLSLRRKEYVIILPDQNPGRERAQVQTRFFGILMPSPSLLTQLQARTGARILCVFAAQLPDKSYRVEFHTPSEKVYSSDIRQAVQGVNDSIEKCVRLYPAQYQWLYKILARTHHAKEYKMRRRQ